MIKSYIVYYTIINVNITPFSQTQLQIEDQIKKRNNKNIALAWISFYFSF